jgi:hypothetical protein
LGSDPSKLRSPDIMQSDSGDGWTISGICIGGLFFCAALTVGCCPRREVAQISDYRPRRVL